MKVFHKLVLGGLLAGIIGLLAIFGFVTFNKPIGPSTPVHIVDIPPGTAFTQIGRASCRERV